MQLKQLKLAGFKSFVDPTVIPFPSQLVAVVGPNGCGKSNVIDAVRWVMGESAAKNLRGESMTDVIFNGSSTRKAVGQASVELVFDNSMGRLTGQYASYQEISVKRLITRDGDSSYFLNGTRCRRRDITDIFLGTGAGARGYSIIGQGTISKIIEARPEELRAFLEEAAGISKYKERRRETVLRIGHTRENLLRVADVREELGKQLQRLERQAKTAARYQELVEQEKRCKAEILALKWDALIKEQEQTRKNLAQLLISHEQHQTQSTTAYRVCTEMRESLYQKNQQFQLLQEQFYQLATEIARLEESREQQHREKQRLQSDQQQLQNDWQTVCEQLQLDAETLASSELNQKELDVRLDSLRDELDECTQAYQSLQEEFAAWQNTAGEVSTHLNKLTRDSQLEQLRLQHIQQRTQECQIRLEKITIEKQQLPPIDGFDEQFNGLQDALSETAEQSEKAETQSQLLMADIQALKRLANETESSLRQQQSRSNQLNVEQASLSAALHNRVNQQHTIPQPWSARPRLIEKMQVEKGWEYAIELILGLGMHAVVVDDISELMPALSEQQITGGTFTTAAQTAQVKQDIPCLADKIQGLIPEYSVNLSRIYAAEDLEQARAWLPRLKPEESVITPQGIWMAQAWLQVILPQEQSGESLLVKQQQLNHCREKLAECEAVLEVLQGQLEEVREQIQNKEFELENWQDNRRQRQDQQRQLKAEIDALERQIAHQKQMHHRFDDETHELYQQLEELNLEKEDVQIKLSLTQQELQRYEQEQTRFNAEKQIWDEHSKARRQSLDDCRSRIHQIELQREREALINKQLSANIQREEVRQQTIGERLEKIAQRLFELETPDSSRTNSLDDKLAQHQELEDVLCQYREAIDSLNQSLSHQESLYKAEESAAKTLQDKTQQEQLQLQTLTVRIDTVLENLNELNVNPKDILNEIPEESTWALCEQQLQEIVDKIGRLGAINLAAIEEYETEAQRKLYLDEQHNDLTEALSTLEAAIEKMDKETRQRLQITFDEVNSRFQSLFPRLFGGGRAFLELTCDNLLEAGIMVMAQPPGKRNSTIHLLSGGEKAMTAVALVFAIFQLNPSPFCMLDEVDAPLDDVNVGRFCALVKEMSQFVQFLFITHNKIAMELADHLIGVTMREPGVSRVVTVDVEQALVMTES
ncbi:chromosome segregation protein SMC [Legionella genomosp. 1]|uniref:chromosome segregation protein SMC n=1 Tax=Legionella genomosp. 1 TaxID=1093625 RepID=UPI001055075E|nr:chromosome segregation protein SMC [Legionella genomosp. 1]